MRRIGSGLALALLACACGGGSKSGAASSDAGASSSGATSAGSAGSNALAGSSGNSSGGSSAGLAGDAGNGGTATQGGSPNGSGGAAGATIVSGGSAGAGGAPIMLHQCAAAPDPSCPQKVLTGNVFGDGSTLAGVTEVTGNVTILQATDLSPLACLETVDGEVQIGLDISTPMSLWALRNLQTVGFSLTVAGDPLAVMDCGLAHLKSLGQKTLFGSVDVRNVGGELDLSNVQFVTNVRVESSLLTRVTLPSHVSLSMGQLWFDSNPQLQNVEGFTSVTLSHDQNGTGVRIVKNPQLSNCRAQALAALFVAAGFDGAGQTVSGNLADCP